MRPQRSWVAQPVMRYELAYQAMSSMEWKSSVMEGMAVEMIVRSWRVSVIDFKLDSMDQC